MPTRSALSLRTSLNWSWFASRRRMLAVPIVSLCFLSCNPDLLFGDPSAVAVAIAPGPSATLSVGEELLLSATAQQRTGRSMPGAPISWSSSDSRIATVSAVAGGGRLRGLATGSAVIQAAFGGASSSIQVQVRVPVSSVSVSPPSITLAVGQSTQLAAVTRDASGNLLTGRTLLWASSDGGVASVSGSGVVSALSTSGAASRTISVSATSEGRVGSATIVVVR